MVFSRMATALATFTRRNPAAFYGNTFYNARAAFAPPGSPCIPGGAIVCTPLGNFTSYTAGSPVDLVPRNFLTMAGLVSLNVRVARTFGFGERRSNPNFGDMGGGPGGDHGFGGGGRGPGGGGGERGGGGGMRMG